MKWTTAFLVLALAIVAAPIVAAPSIEVRSDNTFTVRGFATTEPAPVEFPAQSIGFQILLANHPIDGPVSVACGSEASSDCKRVHAGDRVIIRGEVRSKAGVAILVAHDLKVLKEGEE